VPSRSTYRVLSTSWRAMTSESARPSAPSSSAPRSRNVSGTRYSTLPGSSRSRNHSRCCSKDSGSGSPRATGAIGATSSPLPSRDTSSASPATVATSNSRASGSSTRNASRSRDTTLIANSECPPRSKKLLSLPTGPCSSTCSQIPAIRASVGVRGAT